MRAKSTVDKLFNEAKPKAPMGRKLKPKLATRLMPDVQTFLTNTHKNARNRYEFDEENVLDVENEYRKAWQDSWGFTLGGYVYYPVIKKSGDVDFVNWSISDGGTLRAGSIGNLVLGWGGKDEFIYNFISAYPEHNDLIIKKKVQGQEEYEGGVMKGDWY